MEINKTQKNWNECLTEDDISLYNHKYIIIYNNQEILTQEI